MMVRAERDLQAGEEIVVNYYGNVNDRKPLMRFWQINCDCPWCQERDKTPPQAAQRRASLLENGPCERERRYRSRKIEKWIQSLEATYIPEDKFRGQMVDPLLLLMRAYSEEGNADQAIATGRRALAIERWTTAGWKVTAHMMIAANHMRNKRVDLAKEELRRMRQMCWNTARITLTQLKLVAKERMEEGDPRRVLVQTLCEVEEEEWEHSS
jgi:hypothetical protein